MNDPHDVDERGSRATDAPSDLILDPARTPEPGSFRDRNGSVFYRDGRVFRGLSARALGNWQRLQAAPFFDRQRAAGRIVDTWPADAAGAGPASSSTSACPSSPTRTNGPSAC